VGGLEPSSLIEVYAYADALDGNSATVAVQI